ncbi:MAG TPA: hypothetical protein VGJ81_14295 [Thermoanaerobaculia bacterium]|jgi:hypothetical protein
MNAVLGIADHYAASEFVTVGVADGALRLLSKERVQLVDPELPAAPYHHEALTMPLEAAEEVVASVRASVAERCRQALSEQIARFGIGAVVIQSSPYDALPETLGDILASWQITCAADGMMYREMLATSAEALGLKVERYARKSDRVAAAAESLQVPRARVEELLKEFGKQAGSPWRKEHQEAAASALAFLGAAI